MSKKATGFQKKEMSKMYRGTEIFKPLNTGWIDENVACVREWVANIFFYRRGGTTIMIDAGYNYERLEEKMGCTILRQRLTPSGRRCSGSVWTSSPIGAQTSAGRRTSITAREVHMTASPS